MTRKKWKGEEKEIKNEMTRRVLKDVELRREKGYVHYGDWMVFTKKEYTKNKAKKFLMGQIMGSMYYIAQLKRNWEMFWPDNLKWYYIKGKHCFGLGWMLEAITEKELKKW